MKPHILRESAIVGAALFVLYAIGACRTIYVGDSGELVAAVYTLGIPHPSGYPLYVLLGKLFTVLVPVGSIAFRMSLFSAAAGAAAAAIVYALARRLDLGRTAALVGALLLAFAPSFWGEANVQRVYTLNALFVAAATLTGVEWTRHRRDRALVATAFLCGLGASNHTFMAVFALMFGVHAVIVDHAVLRRITLIAQAAAAFAIGLLPYLFLFVRAHQSPRLDWGRPDTLLRLWHVITRHDFWDRRWIEEPNDLVVIAFDHLKSLGSELVFAGALLAVIGVVVAKRRGWPVVFLLLVMGANLAAMAAHGSRTDLFVWHRYYIPSYMMAALLAALGAQVVLERFGRPAQVAVLLIPAIAFGLGFRAFDRSRYRIADDFSRQLLAAVPPGGHLSATDDNILFVLIYLQFVENVRPDVDLILQGVGGADLPPLQFDPDTNPLYLTHHPNWNIKGLEVIPVGLVFQTVRSNRPLPEPRMPDPFLPGESDTRVPKDYLTQNLIGHFHYMRGITWETRDWERADAEFQKAMAASPDNDVLFFNLGLIYRRAGKLDQAEKAFLRSYEINPRHLAATGRVRALDRLNDVRAQRRANPQTP